MPGQTTQNAARHVELENITEQEHVKDANMEEKTVKESTRNTQIAKLVFIVQSMVNGEAGQISPNAASLVALDHTTEQENAKDRNMEGITAKETIKNTKNATLESTVPRMVTGENGPTFQPVTKLAAKEPTTEQENALAKSMAVRNVKENIHTTKIAKSNTVQSTATGENGLISQPAARLAEKENTTEQENVWAKNTMEKTAKEMTLNTRIVMSSIVQLMGTGENGPTLLPAVKLVAKDPTTEKENALAKSMAVKIVKEKIPTTKIAMLNTVQSTATGENGLISQPAARLAEKDPTTEKESALARSMAVKNVKERTHTTKIAKSNTVQLMATGENGQTFQHAVKPVEKENTTEQDNVWERNTEVKIAQEMTKNTKIATSNIVQSTAPGEDGQTTLPVTKLAAKVPTTDTENVWVKNMEAKIAKESLRRQNLVTVEHTVQVS